MSNDTTTSSPSVGKVHVPVDQERLGEEARTPVVSQEEATCPLSRESESKNGEEAKKDDYPIVDFVEPAKYNWTEELFEADQALKEYSEHTHGDY